MPITILVICKTLFLFFVTAIAEIAGCYLSYLWFKQGKTFWLLLPAGACLGLFAWLLALHPTGASRTYAAYGGVYVATALLWMWWVEGNKPDRWDFIGVFITLIGMSLIAFVPRGA